jgi:hypothetical protein
MPGNSHSSLLRVLNVVTPYQVSSFELVSGLTKVGPALALTSWRFVQMVG